MADPKIQIIPNGPYRVHGPVTITDAEGHAVAVEEGRAVSMCRCGASANRPFCDGTHGRIGFSAAERAVK